ncbi:MAG: hypothetical protein ACOYJ6_17500 [Caulobacterales bacterium]
MAAAPALPAPAAPPSIILAAAAAPAKTRLCALGAPKFIADAARFEITLTCGATGAAFPVSTPVLVGMTAYEAPPEAKPAPAGPGGAKRIALVDITARSHDLAVQETTIGPETKQVTLSFAAKAADLTGKSYWLFAAWPAAQRQPCDRKDAYARSGCKAYGYVLGDGNDAAPLTAYPGVKFETVDVDEDGKFDPNIDHRAQYWIVEAFR